LLLQVVYCLRELRILPLKGGMRPIIHDHIPGSGAVRRTVWRRVGRIGGAGGLDVWNVNLGSYCASALTAYGYGRNGWVEAAEARRLQ
jgi:hypothetical protein